MQLRFHLFLFCFMIEMGGRSVKSYEKNDYFLVFLAAWVIFSMLLGR